MRTGVSARQNEPTTNCPEFNEAVSTVPVQGERYPAHLAAPGRALEDFMTKVLILGANGQLARNTTRVLLKIRRDLTLYLDGPAA